MQDSNELVNIEVQIADRVYPLKVVKNQEQSIREAVAGVNETVKEYQRVYPGKNKQDYLAMCLLNYAVERVSGDSKSNHLIQTLEAKITSLEHIFTT